MSRVVVPSESVQLGVRQRTRDVNGEEQRWTERVRSFLATLRPIVLSAFVAKAEAAARAAPLGEAERNLLFRRTCADAAFALLAGQARQRKLPVPAAWTAGHSRATAAALTRAVAGLSVEFVGAAYENLLSLTPKLENGKWDLAQSHERRTEGVYFTPPTIARFIVEKTLDPKLRDARIEDLQTLTVVDPAMGYGAFLVEALHRIAGRACELGLDQVAASRLAIQCLYGVDKDAEIVRIGSAILWVEAADPGLSLSALADRFKVGDSLLGPAVGPGSGEQSGQPDLYGRSAPANVTAAEALTQWKNERVLTTEVFDWHLAFPAVFLDKRGCRRTGGFDAVLGNPPWGKIKAEVKEFFSVFDERVRNLQGSELRRHVAAEANAAWTEFKQGRVEYAKQLKSIGTYRHQKLDKNRSTGDTDLYKLFLERAFQISSAEGRVGLVVPASFYQSESAAGVRALYLQRGEFEELLSFENRERYFPIHGMFKYTLVVWQRGGPPGIRRARFNLPRLAILSELGAQNERADDSPSMSVAWLRSVSRERLIVPELRGRAEAELYGRLHRQFPPLGEIHQSWNVDFVREFDMTNDRDAFFEEDDLLRLGAARTGDGRWGGDGAAFVPLYEGRLVHQFDHLAKTYHGGAGRRAQWSPCPLGGKSIRPHYWVREDPATRLLPARASFCDITGHANERTVLAALVPAGVPCGNKVPTLRFDRDDARLPYLWLAVANSFVVDWILRRRVSTTMNFFHWKMTPFPRLDPNDALARELWTGAARLSGVNGESAQQSARVLAMYGETADPAPMTDVAERARVRARLDVIVAELFGLDWVDLDLILKDFPLIDRKQPPLSGERRSTITRDLLQTTWAARRGGTPFEQRRAADRLREATRLGAMAYVPSEHV